MNHFDGKPKSQLSVHRGDYFYFGRYKTPLLYYALLQNWADVQDTSLSLPIVKGQIVVLDGYQYILLSDWNLIKEKTVEALEKKNEKYFLDYFKTAEKICNELLAESEHGDETDDTVRSFERLFFRMHNLQYPWYMVLPMAQAAEDWLKTKINEDALPIFFTPNQPTLLAQYQRSLRDIIRLIDTLGLTEQFEKALNSDYMRIVETHLGLKMAFEETLNRFPWVGMMHFWGERNSYEKLFDSVRHSMSSVDDFPLPFAFGKNLDWVMLMTQRLSYFRQHFAELCAIVTFQLYELFQKYNISYETALYLTPDELIAYIVDQKTIPQEVIDERKRGFGLFNGVVTGAALQALMKQFNDPIVENSEICGTIAFRGNIKGIAKIVLSPADMGKMKKGEILVAHETTPDVLPVMYQAAAFVTDVGGLTSHAAIVAREMKKPCIIGAKIATQVLKDGDLVEVDADSGVVRIIERARE